MQLEVKTTTVTTPANEVLGKKETTLYYLVIGTENPVQINIGEKTYNAVNNINNAKPKK